MIGDWGFPCEIAPRWMSSARPYWWRVNIGSGNTVKLWCHQATNHCLSKCWPQSMLPYDVTRPQWVKQHHMATQIWVHRKNSSNYRMTTIILDSWQWVSSCAQLPCEINEKLIQIIMKKNSFRLKIHCKIQTSGPRVNDITTRTLFFIN